MHFNKVKKWKIQTNYSIIDLIKKSVNHFSKDHISLDENMKEETVILSVGIVGITMIDLRRKLLVMYVIKPIMKFKYKNRKKHALFVRINSIELYLRRKQVFASMVHSTLYEMNIHKRRSVWANQREELWFDNMLNDQNFE